MPIFPDRGTASRFANASQAATASALWRDTGISADLPAPPVFTLDDRIRFFALGDLPSPPSDRTGSLSPSASSSSSSFVRRTRAEMSGSRAAEVDGEERERGRGSPIDGLIEPGALITPPPPPRPREIVKPGSQGCSMQNGGLGADGWVTVYGFPPSDTNMVLREFEKCGVISKHVHGPSNANWIHILYQNPSEAQMALKKNGMQLNSLLIIAVKRIDPMHRHHLDETSDRLNRGSFMVSLPSKSTTLNSSSTGTPSTVLTRAHHQQSIATPATSALSKVMDLIFGI
ncbi:nuclear pore complex protein NUP35-like isoform X1 [Musa acuminata AAA Group]|uniref:nuclear pore complex protein NUP35-like isoform X1 n=1 Tax=Musa acuminata AAA Group TaxID=214697 RepID=UPI0031DAFC59